MAGLTVATEILNQMGGSRMLGLMLGAYGFVGDDNSLMFAFKGSRKANKCRVILDYATDTYRFELWKFKKHTGESILVSEFDDVYCDQLRSIFESETGLYLSL